MTQKNIWRWTSLKKNKKSVPTEKKFWIISIAVGICLVVLSVCFFSNADKEKKEADLLDTVNYVKVQCSTYTHYNEYHLLLLNVIHYQEQNLYILLFHFLHYNYQLY